MAAADRDQSGSNFRRLFSNLKRDGRAMAILGSFGIDELAAQALGLGLKESYQRADGSRVENVLAFPLSSADGRRRYSYLNLPEHTINPEHPVSWGPGRPQTISAGQGELLLVVCPSAIEVWQLEKAAAALPGVTAIASSQSARTPAEWMSNGFWASWGRVVIMRGVDDGVRQAIGRVAKRPLEEVSGSLAENGSNGVAIADTLRGMLDQAISIRLGSSHLLIPLPEIAGDFDVRPISVHGGLAQGYLYYAFTVERREVGESGRADRVLHRYETLVLRSDGELLEATTLPAPRGTPAHRRVHALSDGTRISAIPEPGHHSSWSLAGIRGFVAARLSGEDPCEIKPAELAASAVSCLRHCVLLPRSDDYWLLTAFVMASYVHRLFDALPLIHVHGEKGTGKSELISMMVELGFNGELMAQGSAAALIRLVRESGGLVAIDDAENIACGTSEISQALKSGYKKSTATKIVTLPGGRTETIDFFGPRIVCNTLGLDHVLASRSIRVATESSGATEPEGSPEFNATLWRDAMHAFAMGRLKEISAAYDRFRTGVRDRRSEIRAPLRAIAEVVGIEEMITAVSAD